METGDIELARKIRKFFLFGIPVVCAALLGIIASQMSGWIGAVGVCSMILLGAGSVGGGLGFLFALPRILTKKDEDAAVSTVDPSGKQTLAKRLLGSNTNLEQVSDWLTTMIVGVGLTQLGAINGALYNFRIYLRDTATVFHGTNGPSAGVLPAVGPMILLFGLVFGFVFLYLYTRIIITVLLNKAEQDLFPLTKEQAHAVKSEAIKLSATQESPAIKALAGTAEPSVYESIELMGSMLYQSGRYQDVINLGGKLANSPASMRAEYWLYLAAAFGQKYHKLLASTPKNDSEVASARMNALDCARRAVNLDSSMKTRLWYISDPAGEDDDLGDLRNDNEFRTIVGKEPDHSQD